MTNWNHRKAQALALTLVATPALALAGGEETPSTDPVDELQDLKTRVEALEAQKADSDAGLPSWLKKWTFKGDFRYRWERFDVEGKNRRNRHRVRARIYAGVDVTDYTTFGVALATGAEDPVSTNATLGEGFEELKVNFDEAFINYHPWNEDQHDFNGAIIAGKMRTPFQVVTKGELLWDADLRPEGIAAQFDTNVGSTNLFFNAGGFFLRENSSGTDTGLGGGQLGAIVPISASKLTFGAGYYDYIAIQGRSVFDWQYNNGYKSTANGYGNSTDAADGAGDKRYTQDYDELEVFAGYDMKAGDLPLAFFGNYVQNTAASNDDTGYNVGAKLGKASKPGTWDARLLWKKVEKDAVVAAFTDSDFGGGGTDVKGTELNLGYAIDSTWKVGLTWFHNQNGISGASKDYDRFQLDFKWKF